LDITTNFGQSTGLRKKLVAACKQNILKPITEDNKKSTGQKAEGTRGDHSRDFWVVTISIPCILIQLLLTKPPDASTV
jgi:hypothetical protein